MVSRKSFGIGGIITIVVVALIAGALVPPAINAATGADFSEQTETFGLAEGQTYNFTTANVSATLDNVNGSTSEATYSFVGGPDSDTLTIAEGDNASTTLNGTTYNVNVTEVDGTNNEATAVVSYDTGGGGTAGTIWNMVPLFMVIAVALLFVGFAGKDKSDL